MMPCGLQVANRLHEKKNSGSSTHKLCYMYKTRFGWHVLGIPCAHLVPNKIVEGVGSFGFRSL